MKWNLLRSKTVWGAVIGVVGWALNQPHIDLPTVVTGIGTILGAGGIRDALHKVEESK